MYSFSRSATGDHRSSDVTQIAAFAPSGQYLRQNKHARHRDWCRVTGIDPRSTIANHATPLENTYRIAYYSTAHHIASHHITSHHIASHHIAYHITSHHITSHHITSHRITYCAAVQRFVKPSLAQKALASDQLMVRS